MMAFHPGVLPQRHRNRRAGPLAIHGDLRLMDKLFGLWPVRRYEQDSNKEGAG
jgi:hypothetical protein